MDMAISTAVECQSLNDTGLELSTFNLTAGTEVRLSCDEFGHKPSGGIDSVECLNNGSWSRAIPSCKWSWDFNTEEKIIFGTCVAGVSFIILVIAAIFIAYYCCYKKRRDKDEKLFNSSYYGSSPPPNGYDGPYNSRDSYPVTYLAYQDVYDPKFEGYANTGTLDKPWLGYIPRPKVSEGRVYN